MIARISGRVIEKGDNYLIIDVNGLCYEVLLPTTVRERIDGNITSDGIINLITYHYHHVEPSRSIPILIGFSSDIEKEFFEVFITVSGIGPRAALKALNKPISQIAQAIDDADAGFLKSLPGIGQQRAREVIAKLQHKVGKFCLIQDVAIKESTAETRGIEDGVLAVLIQLQYKKSEALAMIRKALERAPDIETAEQLLNEVYKQKKIG